MKILLTNDDGINAEGILALYDALKDMAEVTMIAPDSERSAVGHGITIADPLRVKEFKRDGRVIGYSTSGTPADCVKLGISTLMIEKPDIVVSGINAGPNLGINVLYSGTVSGAMEGAILGIPSMALSLASWTDCDYGFAARHSCVLARNLVAMGLPAGTMLNVNFPAIAESMIKGEIFTFQSRVAWIDKYQKRTDPGMRSYYWLSGNPSDVRFEDGSDGKAVDDGFTSLTPIHCDLTDWKMFKKLG